MIRNRLSELLSERGLKISRVAKEVEIARSSLTSMVQNDSEMIRYDAIERLCTFLNISPNDFFEYTPISVEYTFDEHPNIQYDILQDFERKLVLKKFDFDFLVDIKNSTEDQSFDLDISFKSFHGDSETIFKVNDEDSVQELKEIINKLSPGLKSVLYKKLQKNIQSYVTHFLIRDITYNINYSLSDEDIDKLKKAFEKKPVKLVSNIFTEY
ncbi:helix-turn-helix domain-containing protein [Mammaliicoccus fleurettii]|uniref:Helix-turn-helix domain-containing protein n=1 Tax=Mammaliicoccus fleurettii TaxID=150056 RepID=A0ABS5MLN9_9STAP|nr:helix-turn-helix transcriptional regulator [Mammaliicoccus fleurettii]MBL0846994.1 helix-turn-helix domain-containing protein [Mammaliicoccus fleurettii]MBS3671718.1 helix-turn-helix domain-containing protein [Mammaliicoccus fleurettii]MBS3696784.1 helix-turn-helix domain-containing protein [Mammaliicoccus fleurettii]